MTKSVYICGICGTFMAGIAQIAKQLGYKVHGCDANAYPPMSTLLNEQGIHIDQGYQARHLEQTFDDLIIGNALGRGNELIESALHQRRQMYSGPSWLHDNILLDKKPIAIAGTHGKTSTASMLAWILESNSLNPSFLIGGRPGNFDNSARLTDSDYFVIEADEYDTAFFDKRSKFVHYQPHGVILNNLEFDHADIFNDLAQIQTQFHHLIRLVPDNGYIIVNADDLNLRAVLDKGAWSPLIFTSVQDPSSDWYAKAIRDDHSQFDVYYRGNVVASVDWQCIGVYNMHNALNAIAAASMCGIDAQLASQALGDFIASARRLQELYRDENTFLFEDFAHHPTAIKLTLDALRSKFPNKKLLAILEPRSNTMRAGHHRDSLGDALNNADYSIIYEPTKLNWDTQALHSKNQITTMQNSQQIIDTIVKNHQDSVIVCLSNGSFDAIPMRLKEALTASRQ